MLGKEIYIFTFETTQRAFYWMEQFVEKFQDEVRHVDKQEGIVELKDDTCYVFWREDKLKYSTLRRVPHTVYPEDAIYIILDDPERFRL